MRVQGILQSKVAPRNDPSLTEKIILSRAFLFLIEKEEEALMKLNDVDFETYFNHYPDKNGYFGKYGGVYIDEKLKKAMEEITEAYFSICQSRKFIAELRRIRKEFQGRPTPVTHLERLSDMLGGKVQDRKSTRLNSSHVF